ncbi:amino acid adenylation domain-containing protein [Nocardiopsis sp. NPDC006938]|uniref:non-ribosomal peptide synthetase n=1 Tax=Nocardiopsis sp. NPDC006938 TaxID=3364337 RepID=UPI0036CA1A76
MNHQSPVPQRGGADPAVGPDPAHAPVLVQELVSARAETDPDAVAVRGGRTALTYRDLESAVNRLARGLIGRGVGRGSLVAVRLPRSPELVICLLAVLRAGAAYLPLDPRHPVGRAERALRESGAGLLVAEAGTAVRADVPVLLLDDPAERAAGAARSVAPVRVPVDPDELAYVIYTSGSTGLPKGVMVPHRGLAAYTEWALRELGPQLAAGSVLHTSVAFDLALTSLYPVLAAGGAVTVVDGAGVEPLADVLGDTPYGLLKLTPTHLDALVETVPGPGLASAARVLVVGGEQLRAEQLRAWAELAPETLVVNSYGPTETTVACCAHVARAGDLAAGNVPVGLPIAGALARVLDARLAPVADGAAGELYVSGPGVARGYLAAPALTAERFVPDPFGPPGTRMYRTGDVVRRRADGVMEFLHRADRQVKVDGHRIEPAEVEQAAREVPGVRAAAAVAVVRDGRTRLALHLAAETGTDPGRVRAHLARRLPEACVPSLWTVGPALPLLANGKVDRSALPEPSPLARGSEPPRGPSEERAADAWRDALRLDAVGRHDDFVALGGHSLLAARVARRLTEATGTAVTAGDVLTSRTVAALAALLDERARAGRRSAAPLVRSAENGPAPLSAAQRGLWFLDQLHPGRTEYLVPVVLRLRGRLDTDALDRALTRLVRRHEALRTRYRTDDAGDPVAVVDPPAPLVVEAERADPGTVVDEELSRPVDLEHGPVLRVRLVRTEPERHVLVLVIHHIATDGWSTGLIADELARAYAAPAGEGEPAPPQVRYSDYARWQRDRLAGPRFEEELEAWRNHLSGAPVVELPTDRPRSAVRDTAGASHRFTVPADLVRRLSDLGAARGATPFAVHLAGWLALTHRRTGGTDLCVGVPVSGRSAPGSEDVVGFFADTAVLRTPVSASSGFGELVDRVARESALAHGRDGVPFDRLVEAVAPERDLARTPLFQVMFAFQPAGAERFALPGLEVVPEEVDARSARFDLTLELVPAPDGSLRGHLSYATALFDRATVRTLADHYVRLLEGAAEDPALPVGRLEVMAPGERAALVDLASGPVRPRPDAGVPELVAEQAARTPGAVAVRGVGAPLTYAEVDGAANGVARALVRRGVRPGDVVGLCVRRGPALVTGMLGVLRAGAAYLPLDPEHPAERLAFVTADAGARLTVTETGAADGLPGGPLLFLDREECAPVAAAPVATDPDAPAYVVHTSGSTGRPKGVVVPHRGIRNRVLWAVDRFGIGPGDRFLQKTTATFDAMAWEVMAPLVAGGTVVLAEHGAEADPALVAGLLVRERITLLQGVPSFLRLLAEEPDLGRADDLRLVFSAGEPLPVRLADRLADAGGARVVNTYGPTECSIDVTFHVRERSDDGRDGRDGAGTVPIGRPLDNTTVLVLGPDGLPVAPGVPGELYVAGEGLAHGYAGRPAQTAERFVPDPHGPPGGRLYRTGDVVRHAPSGELEFLGRADDQVKIRGVRVEPGEVEAVLREHPGVSAVAVTARPGPDGQTRLLAYAVPSRERLDEASLRALAADRLPGPWRPSLYVPMTALPVTTSGKVDRAALPDPGGASPDGGSREPRTPMERVVARVWCRVLERDAVGAEDDFFDLGGHSLLATRVTGALGAELGARVPVRALFEARTVAALARALEEAGAAGAGHGPADTADTAGAAVDAPEPVAEGPVPLSPAQERMWFLDTLRPGTAEYTITWALEIGGGLDVRALERALGDVVERHPALRTRYPTGADGVPHQVVEPPAPFRLPVADTGRPLAEELSELAATGFDLAAAPPVRPRLLRLAEDRHALVLVVHHIAFDAWSEEVLARDLAAAYTARREGRAPDLPTPATDPAAHAVREVRRARGGDARHDLAYWTERLAGLRPSELVTDRPRPRQRDTGGAAVELVLPRETAEAVDALGRSHGATPFMTYLALFTVLLSRHTGEDDVAVGTPVAGRGDSRTDDLVGLLVNTLVLRVDTGASAGGGTFGELLRRVRGTALDAYDHAGLAFERLVEELAPERDQSRNPLFDIMFELTERPWDGAPDLPGLSVRRVRTDRVTAKFDLTLGLSAETGGGYRVRIEYATALFDEATVLGLGRQFVRLARSAAADPGARLAELDMLGARERDLALGPWSGEVAHTPAETVHEAFRAQAERTPERVAVEWDGGRLTYGGLLARSDALADRLVREGVTPEAPVGVYLDRSPDAVVVLFAVLAAGGVYVPLDTAHPVERTAFMLGDLGAAAVVAHDSLAHRLAGLDVPVVRLTAEGGTAAPTGPDSADPVSAPRVPAPARPVRGHSDPDRLAYAIYTSGSTGRPKGVMIDHRAYAHHCRTVADAYDIRPGDRVVLLSALTFDVSMDQIAAPLLLGASVVVSPPGFTPPEELPGFLGRHRVTHMEITPAYYREMMTHVGVRDPRLDHLRLVVVSSDVVTADDARIWRDADLPGRFLPTYGPTEATVTCMTHALEGQTRARPESALPVGRPIPGTRTYVLDPLARPAPVGVPGELCVGGDRLARGYLGRPATTAERFVPDPYGPPGSRLYRTGDLARYRADGVVEFLGRIDTQVKVRGFRIELGEVEAVLAAHPGVRAAAVTAPVVGGERRLVGHVVHGDSPASVAELRRHLADRLPDYMVPGLWTVLDAMPLTPSKKVDRRALPVPDPAELVPDTAYVAPRDEIERAVAQVWEEVLGRACGVLDDFFLLGGHSILATRVMVRLRDLTGLEVPLSLLFDATTIADQAAALIRLADSEPSDDESPR